MFKKIRHIHFVGIGGIGMSGIAEVLINLGYKITGSDLKRSPLTLRLAKKGAQIFYGHRGSHVEGAHVVVLSSAVKPSNPEWATALKLGIPVIPRGEMLAELMRLKYGIAVAGSHGKTTTTSLIAHVLYQAGLDPTMVIGGRLKNFRSNAKLGKGEFLVAEADESDGSFMKLSPTIAVITNVDPEHLDHYQNFDELKTTFVNFANKIPFYGAVVACADHPTVREILPRIKKRLVTYGLSETADFYARSIKQEGLQIHFEVFGRGSLLGEVRLKLAGLHNVYNSLATIAVGTELEIPFKKIVAGLQGFKGIERRMEPLYHGKGGWVIDDYGHHPEEIKATLSALRMAFPQQRIITLFQPHRYTRTRDLFEEFKQAFGNTDLLLLTEVYAAGEDPIEGVDGKKLADALLAQRSSQSVYFNPDKEGLAQEVTRLLKPNDVVVTLGAGDIVKVGKKLAQWMKKNEAGGRKPEA
jgi:UDP-N-acetylmuramate--alanine ligase